MLLTHVKREREKRKKYREREIAGGERVGRLGKGREGRREKKSCGIK